MAECKGFVVVDSVLQLESKKVWEVIVPVDQRRGVENLVRSGHIIRRFNGMRTDSGNASVSSCCDGNRQTSDHGPGKPM